MRSGVVGMANDLASGTEALFATATQGRSIHKHSNYFEVYDRYLQKFQGKRPRILEIGVQHGGSLLMWDAYFSGDAEIVGLDILEDCKKFESENVRIYIGDQSDEAFLRRIVQDVGAVDIIIDDGSHIPNHQIKSFEILFFDLLKEGGVYICEDCQTSYWPRFGGGVRRGGTFIEYSKRLCDQVNAWVANNSGLKVDKFSKWIKSITFYAAVVVFEKAAMSQSHPVVAGEEKIDLERPFKESRYASVLMPLKRNALVQAAVRQNPMLWRLMKKILVSQD